MLSLCSNVYITCFFCLLFNNFNTYRNIQMSQNFDFRKNNSARRPQTSVASSFPKESDLIRSGDFCEARVCIRSSIVTDRKTMRPGFAIVVTSAYCTSGSAGLRSRVGENKRPIVKVCPWCGLGLLSLVNCSYLLMRHRVYNAPLWFWRLPST